MTLALAFTARALFAPWSLDRGREPSRGAAAFLAACNVAVAAALSTALSTWTYLVGKGLLVTVREMDMGRDDLPADTVRQVAEAFVTSLAIWVLLLALAVAVAAAVADWLYRRDRARFRSAVTRTFALTIWFVVWAAMVFAANGVRQRAIRHPAEAVRAYAQLNQHWFRGSSAIDPGPIEREPLVASGRLLFLAAVFPIIWALGMPRARSTSALAIVALAIVFSWIVWAAVWRVVPWTAIDAFAG